MDSAVGIPDPIKMDQIREDLLQLDERKLYKPLSTVFFQEVDRFNVLLAIITDSLEKLMAAVSGTIIMSAVLDDVYFKLYNNQVPKLWSANAYPSLKPLKSWVKDLRNRIEFFKTWVIQGKPDPERYKLPYFFFPQGFLTGVLQTYARDNKIPIDTLKFEFRVYDPDKDTSKEDPLEPGSIVVSGLFLEGARWDRKRRSLLDQFDGELYDEMLPIAFIPKEVKLTVGREVRKAARQIPTYS
jgi:dynein heavy chain